jgi:hypothetical protein
MNYNEQTTDEKIALLEELHRPLEGSLTLQLYPPIRFRYFSLHPLFTCTRRALVREKQIRPGCKD